MRVRFALRIFGLFRIELEYEKPAKSAEDQSSQSLTNGEQHSP